MTPHLPDTSAPAETLQSLVLPEPEISAMRLLYYRRRGKVHHDAARGILRLEPGATVRFDTYFNTFDAAEWKAACSLESLALRLSGSGNVRVQILRITPDKPVKPTGGIEELALERTLTLEPGHEAEIKLSDIAWGGGNCLLCPVIVAGSEGAELSAGRFVTRDVPKRAPQLAVSITTFRREAEVEATARRLDAFLQSYPHGDKVRVQVVDNGQSATVPESAHLRYLTNANLGGAGGFARGMLEARRSGASHCLFMDDDAAFHMENIARTYAMLAYANDPTVAIAGAMIANTCQHEMWENGAVFDGICRPRHTYTDLRRRKALFRMLFRSTERLPDNAYGGWWYFAFPLEQARHYPFPFFVRGDDSGFSLANHFHIRTLNGVVSFQDSFGGKASPLIHYLDSRYHLVHHLVFPDLQRSPLRTALVPLRLIVRSLAQFHYESAEAQLLAMQDVMAGPQFFVDNADMSERRARLGAMTVAEKWRPLQAEPTPVRKRGHIRDRFWALTLNGHLLPLFRRIGADRVLPLGLRGPNWPVWGARKLTYVNVDEGTGYTVEIDRKRGLTILLRAMGEGRRLMRAYPRLLKEYRGRYDEITSEASWEALLGLDPSEQTAPAQDGERG